MANVLEKIVDDKRIEIAQREQDFPLSEFKGTLVPSKKSFIAALSKDSAGFVFECKKASPSKGLIREDFDLDEIVSAYEKEAACFSVLTDEKYFQGKFEYLSYVTSRVSQPVLNKDFFVVPYQVYLARHYNADAVLLMLSVLNDEEYRELSDIAYGLGMEVLTEVSNEEETQRALALQAKIIGINNRDLRDLSTDLATTEKLVPLIRADKNFDGVIISESGIYSHQDLLRLNHLVDGYLVGSSMMAQKDLNRAVSALAYGEVKICGITRTSDAVAISSKAQASYMGLIFAPNSPRYVSLEQALSITHDAPFTYVGVFVDAPLAQLVDYAHKLNLSAVQLHGSESPEYISDLKESLRGQDCEIWKVLSLSQDADAKALEDASKAYSKHDDIDRILLDCKVGKQVGGTGQRFNWDVLNDFHWAQAGAKPVVLAGGLEQSNVKQARQLKVAKEYVTCLDVNSGVESAPGKKELNKIDAVFNAIRI